MPYVNDRTRKFEAETERILLLYHHGKISKREFERRMAEHYGETLPAHKFLDKEKEQ
jgi:hypothetical protein